MLSFGKWNPPHPHPWEEDRGVGWGGEKMSITDTEV